MDYQTEKCSELCTEEIRDCFSNCEPYDIGCIMDCTRVAIQYGKKIGMTEQEVIACLTGDDDDDSI